MKRFICYYILLLVGTSFVSAQQLSEQAQQAREVSDASSIPLESYIKNQQNIASPTNRPLNQESTGPSPFGANLFSAKAPSNQRSSINPNYIVAAGDKISVQLWGSFNLAEVYTVDNQGNIFVTSVGPIKVEGVLASELNGLVTQRIKTIYTDNVDIYVNLLASTPVSVFVTGQVQSPGQFAGSASDSLLFYIHQAGGVDSVKGSYRNIQVIRQGTVQNNIDLYAFLTQGKLPAHSFKDGDVILVKDRGDFVTVEQDEKQMTFELDEQSRVGEDIVRLAQPDPRTSHVAITGLRNGVPMSLYLPLAEFKRFPLQKGDSLIFNDDIRPQVVSVKVSGSYLGPSFYTVAANTKLHDFLAYVQVEPEQAATDSIYILRESVQQQQQLLLDESLSRLERSVFTAPSSSDSEARLRAQEAQLVAQFIDRSRKIEPLGKVVVSIDGQVANVRLEQGDEIVIPQRSDLINVAGEVMLPQAVVFNPNASLNDYVNWAGGFTDRADQNGILIVHANGLTTLVDSNDGFWFGNAVKLTLKPGDQLIITPKADSKLMQSFKDVTQIIYQIAVAANVVTR